MSLRFECQTCGARLQAGDEMAGRKMRCSRCKGVVRAPGGPAAPTERPARDPEPTSSEPTRDREPAPRRRRPPPPPPGRSPLAIVAAVLGALALGGFACCAGGYLLLPSEKWHRYESPDGDFADDLPAPEKKDTQMLGAKPEPGQHVEGTMLWKRGESYVVVYGDAAPAGQDAATADAALEVVVKQMSEDPELRVARVERVAVWGFPAREVEYTDSDGGTYVGRVVVADRHIYVAIAGGPFARPGNANVRRFIDSFAVTGPGPRGAR